MQSQDAGDALLLVLINQLPSDQTPFELLLGIAQGLAGRDRAFPYEQISRRIRAENLVVVRNADSVTGESLGAHALMAAQAVGLAANLESIRRQPFATPTGLKGTSVWFYCSKGSGEEQVSKQSTPPPAPAKKWWKFWQ